MARAHSTGFDSDNHHQEHARTTRLNDDVQASGGFDTLADTRLETEIIDERAGLLSHSQPNDPEAYNEASEDGNKHQAAWLEDNDFSSLPWWKRPSIYWILPPLLPFTIAFGGVMVPKINLILSMLCNDYLADRAMNDSTFSYVPVVFGADNPQCRIPEVQSLASKFQLILNLIAGGLSAIVSPKLGLLSDGYGRTKIIAISSFGIFIGEIITTMVAARPDIFSVNVLLIGGFLEGLFGSVTASVALTQSYAADCTPGSKRNVAFGYFHGILFTGIALGPLAAGYLIKWTGDVLIVFYAVLVCQCIFPIFVMFFVPESVPKERQKYNREKRGIKILSASEMTLANLNPLNLVKPLAILLPVTDPSLAASVGKGKIQKLQRNLIILASIDTAIFGVAMGTMSILVIYAEYMFGWGNFESSLMVSITSSVRVVLLLIALPTLTWYFRSRQRRNPTNSTKLNKGADKLDILIIRVSILFDMLGYVGYCIASTGPLLVLSGVVASMAAMVSPTIQSTLTKHLPSNQTGQLLGAMGLLHALARIVAPTVFNLIYSFTVGTVPQTVWICLAAVIFLGFLASWFLVPHVYISDSPDEDLTTTHGDLDD